MERLGGRTRRGPGVRFASGGRGRDSVAHDRAGGGRGASVGAVCTWGHVGPCYWGSHGGTRRGRGREVGSRWANGEGGGMVSVWVSGLGSTYLERGRVEGGRDTSHSRWTAAWQVGKRRGQGHGQEGGRDVGGRRHGAFNLTMSKSRR